jgi:hypothetical protein
MATVDKDFKVKNGLVVSNGGSFGGTVVVAEPTLSNHATTKSYVDALVSSSMTVSSTAPSSPTEGQFWFDEVTERVHVYYNSAWIAIATLADSEILQDHIHDTSIGGNGLIVSMFLSGGMYNEPGVLIEGGFYNTASFSETYDGGIAIDNFN